MQSKLDEPPSSDEGAERRPLGAKWKKEVPAKVPAAASRPRRAAIWLLVLVGVGALVQSGAFGQGSKSAQADPSAANLVRDVAVVVALILVNGLFSMAEVALISVRRTRIDQLVEEGNSRAKLVAHILSEPTKMLATLQVGVTLIGFLTVATAADNFKLPVAKLISNAVPGTYLAVHAQTIALVAVVLSMSLVTLVVGEISPKSIAVRHAESVALWSAGPVRALQALTTPIVWLVTSLSRILVKPFGVTAGFHSSAMSQDELRILVEQSEEHGVLEREEREMIHSIFDFGETKVHNVMSPRLDISSVEADASLNEAVQVITESGHSRLPVYDDNLDNIVGILHAKDVLRALAGSKHSAEPTIRSMMRSPYFIPANKRVDDLLADFRGKKSQFAVVRDEYGTVTGIVTIEDLLEEIVGEIQDEYDVEEPVLKQVDERTCIVDGKMSLEDFNDRMGLEIPEEDTGTVGGFVFGIMGHQPVVGEVADWENLRFTVEATDGKRIQKVRVLRQAAVDRAADDAAAANGHSEEDE